MMRARKTHSPRPFRRVLHTQELSRYFNYVFIFLVISISFIIGRISCLDPVHEKKKEFFVSSDGQKQNLVHKNLRLVLFVETKTTTSRELVKCVDTLARVNFKNQTVDVTIFFTAESESMDLFNGYHWPHGVLMAPQKTPTFIHALLEPWDSVAIYDRIIYMDIWPSLNPDFLQRINIALENFNKTLYVGGFGINHTPVIPTLTSSYEMKPVQELLETSEFIWYLSPWLGVDKSLFMPSSKKLWSVFQHWLRSIKNEWDLWPSVYQAESRQSTQWARFKLKNLSWAFMITRFLVEYNLFTVFPNSEISLGKYLELVDEEAQEQSQYPSHVLSVFGNLNAAPGSQVQETLSNLPQQHIFGEPTVTMTVVNKAFLPTVKSWLCNVDLGGFRPPHIIWIATDETTYQTLIKVEGTEVILASNLFEVPEKELTYGSENYWLLMVRRTELIGEILDAGFNVFAFETDQIWLHDPRPYILSALQDDVDIVGLIVPGAKIAGNFLFLRSTIATRRLWLEVENNFRDNYEEFLKKGIRNQRIMHIKNDQILLSEKILLDHAFQKANPTQFKFLDPERFTDGTWYERSGKFSQGHVKKNPVIINNNNISGPKNKEERGKRFKHWYYNQTLDACMTGMKSNFAEDVKEEPDKYTLNDALISLIRNRLRRQGHLKKEPDKQKIGRKRIP